MGTIFFKKLTLIAAFMCATAAYATTPEISVILTVFNKEHQIDKVMHGILDCTLSPFELVIVFDGCTDRTEQIVNAILQEKKGMMTEYKALYTQDVNETRANNTGMRAASGAYFLLLQDDMQIIEKGWEQHLIRPMKNFHDVFAVSSLWGANYAKFSTNPLKHAYADEYRGRTKDIFVIRDVICRGPLALDAEVMKDLNYLDEAFAPLYLDDHDLCVRAYQQLHKVCGVYRIDWKALKKTCEGHLKMSNGQYFSEVIAINRKLFWQRYKDYFKGKNHNETRSLT